MKKFKAQQIKYYLSLFIAIAVTFFTGCTNTDSNVSNNTQQKPSIQNIEDSTTDKTVDKNEDSLNENIKDDDKETSSSTTTESTTSNTEDIFAGYKLIEVDGGDLSGHREPNVVVDIGFGDREYWAFTNEYGQLVRVVADKIILQDDKTEPVTSKGRYYPDEAKVPGVESKYLDEGKQIVL